MEPMLGELPKVRTLPDLPSDTALAVAPGEPPMAMIGPKP